LATGRTLRVPLHEREAALGVPGAPPNVREGHPRRSPAVGCSPAGHSAYAGLMCGRCRERCNGRSRASPHAQHRRAGRAAGSPPEADDIASSGRADLTGTALLPSVSPAPREAGRQAADRPWGQQARSFAGQIPVQGLLLRRYAGCTASDGPTKISLPRLTSPKLAGKLEGLPPNKAKAK
jgi:hypothetical protein